MRTLVRQVGFCLICGNSVHSDQMFYDSEEGCVHASCLEKKNGGMQKV
ncbi:DUF2175 family protein [Candidatus Nanosalina sp. VS9-1]